MFQIPHLNHHLRVCASTDELLLLCVNLINIFHLLPDSKHQLQNVPPCVCPSLQLLLLYFMEYLYNTGMNWTLLITCLLFSVLWLSLPRWNNCQMQIKSVNVANVNFDYIEIAMICICCRWSILGPLVSFLSPCLSRQMVFNFGKTVFVVSTCVFVVSSILYICHLRFTLIQLGSLQLYLSMQEYMYGNFIFSCSMTSCL